MSDKLTLNDLASLANEASAIASINSNSAAIETALENTLSRDGTSPNQMGASLDMNSNRILNLPEPQDDTEPLRLSDYYQLQGVAEGSITTAAAYAAQAATSASQAAASAATAALVSGTMPRVNRTSLKALDTNSITVAWCTEAGREGMFHWRTGNYSTNITADTNEGIYLKADAVSSSSGAWVRAWDGPVMLSWFGPNADGSTNDSAIIQSAVTVSGVGATIMFDPNKTYSVWSRITMLDDQTLDLNGATIKACDQVSTTTTQSMTNVTTSVTVSDATSFRVGMSLVFAKQGVSRANLVYQTSLSTSDIRITNIVGNTVTFSPTANITTTFASGSTMVNSFVVIAQANRTKVINGTIDGNRSNRSWARWETEYLMVFPQGTAGSLAENITFQNAAGEAVGIDGTHTKVSKCRFLTIRGNGIHLSATVFPVVENCYFNTCNEDEAIGHQDGAITWSNDITHATIVNNYVTNSKSGVGAFDTTNTDATIVNNTFTGNKVWGVYVAGDAARLVLSNNRIVNNQTDTSSVTGLGYVSTGGIFLNSITSTDYLISDNQIDEGTNYAVYCASSGAGKRVSIDNNQILGKTLIGGVGQISFSNNIVLGVLKIASENSCRVSDNQFNLTGFTDYGISMYSGTLNNVMIANNIIDGGLYGISMDTGPTSVGALTITGNTLENQQYYAIVLNNTAATMEGVMISNNIVRTGTASLTSWTGIMSKLPGTTIIGNQIFSDGAADSKVGISVPNASATKAVISGNITRGSLSNDIVVTASIGAFVYNNFIDNGVVYDSTGNNTGSNVTI